MKEQLLLGVTGSGKTFTMAHVIQRLGRKTLVIAHNKTLAAQLYAEFKEFFPDNAVEYFVSYYDYYQPEAYVLSTDTYVEKDSCINDEIDKLRHSTTRSLMERDDVIVVASVSCIYGIGHPDEYKSQKLTLFVDDRWDRDEFLRGLVAIQYERNDYDFFRGCFRVRGDMVDIFPAHEDSQVIRLVFFGDVLESISIMDPLRGKFLYSLNKVTIYPKSHYVVSEEKMKRAMKNVRLELKQRIDEFGRMGKLVERQRIEQRTLLDLEMLEEMGFCAGIENYSRHLTGTSAGSPPPTLLDFFGDDFLTIIDESHMTIPQVGGMYKGDRARKLNLVEYGFRLPSALDNRPLNFLEFENKLDKTLYVSATPASYEKERMKGEYVQQIIRPTGLLDPMIEVRKAHAQVDDMFVEAKSAIKKGGRVLITTLTKKMAEELTTYYKTLGMKICYLHSDVETIKRMEIIRDLRLGELDILVGINLLREGLDLPEVSLIGILDADKEGFLRSDRSLIQTIGRAARNAQGKVLLYAYKITASMERAIEETKRRREIQQQYNKEQGITPKTVSKKVSGGIIETLRGDKRKKNLDKATKKVELTVQNLNKEIETLKKLMKEAGRELRFEDAIKYRNRIKELSEARFLI